MLEKRLFGGDSYDCSEEIPIKILQEPNPAEPNAFCACRNLQQRSKQGCHIP